MLDGGKLKSFINFLQYEKGLAENTVEAYTSDLKLFDGFLEKTKPAEIDEDTLVDFIFYLKTSGHISRSIARALVAVKGFYRFLTMTGKMKKSPFEDMDSFKVKGTIPEVLAESEIEKLLSAPDMTKKEGIRDKAIMELLYSAGLRVSELAGLWSSPTSTLRKKWCAVTARGRRNAWCRWATTRWIPWPNT